MKQKSLFHPKYLGILAVLGALLILINLMTGTFIVMATGIFVAGAFVMFSIHSFFLAFTRLLIKRFWSATIMSTVIAVLALATPIVGPPGFAPKIPILILIGLSTDIVFSFLKKRELLASIIFGLVYGLITPVLVVLAFKLFLPPPAVEKFLKIFPILLGIAWAEGILGGYIAYTVYKKIESYPLIRRIQS